MRSLAVVATLMFLGSTEARLFGGKKNKKQVCGPCPNGAIDCNTSCTSSTVRTVTEQTCTTCTKKVKQVQPKVVQAPITYELVQKPVAYAIVQKPVEHVAKPAPCVCNQSSCGPCSVPKPVITCSITCTTADCIPCAVPSTPSTPIPLVPQPAQVPLVPASKTTVVVDKRINQPSTEIIVDGNGLVSVGGKTITA